MSGNIMTGEDFLKWAESLGFLSSIPPAAFNKLLTPQMMSFWRHVTKHVKSKEEVEHIKKNLLLEELKHRKASQKHHKKLPIKIGKISQIAPVETYEKLVKTLEKSNAEITSTLEHIEKLNLTLKKEGKKKKEIFETVESKTTQHRILKEKERHSRKVLGLKSLISPMEALYLPSISECSQPSHRTVISANPSPEVENVLDKLKKLEHQLEQRESGQMILNEARNKREIIRNYLRENFSSTLPPIILDALVMKLKKLSHDLACAVVSTDDAEEWDNFKKELEMKGIKDLNMSLKIHRRSLISDTDEVDQTVRSVDHKRQKLNEAKSKVLKIMLKVMNGKYEDDLTKWIDLSFQEILVNEKIEFLQGCNNQILEDIRNSEDSIHFSENINQSILSHENKIKFSTRLLKRNLNAMEVSGSLSQNECLKQKFILKIQDFQKRIRSRDSNNPISNLHDFLSSDLSLLLKAPVEVFKISSDWNFNTESLPFLPMYSPYYPEHLIIQDTIEKLCWSQHSLKMLEEILPSPPLDVDIADLMEHIKAEESEQNAVLEQNILESQQNLNTAKQLLEQAAENISYGVKCPLDELIPDYITHEGFDFKKFKSKVLESLEKDCATALK